MNTSKTVPAATPASTPAATPTRRQALTGLFGMAAAATAGLAAAPKSAPAATAPAKSPTFDAELARLNELGTRKLTPAEAKLEEDYTVVLLPAFLELLDALEAVQDQHGGACEDEGCDWRADVEGLLHNVQWMSDLAESDTPFDVKQVAELEIERRQAQVAAGGTRFQCPVFRAANALDRLAEVLDETVAAHEAAGAEEARLAYDAKVWGWTLAQVRAGFDSRDIGHMTPAAREEAVKQLHEQCLADAAASAR